MDKNAKDRNITIIDASSLLSLKAELLKKQESAKQAKLNTFIEAEKYRPFRVKGEVKAGDQKREKKVESKDAEDLREENLALQKSRAALEAKSKLYDKIASNPGSLNETEDEMYLVNFHRKAIRNKISIDAAASKLCSPSMSIEHDLADSEMPSSSNTTHYQNVHFNEKRDFGVGYFSFSTAEEERKQQLEDLNTLHEKTKKRRLQHEEAMEKKKQSLEARLAKICRRRNIDTSLISELIPKDDPPPSQSTNIVDLDSIPLPESKDIEEKPAKVRPWDIGKQFINFQKGEDLLSK